MTNLTPAEADALRTFYKQTKGDRIHYAGSLEKALEKVLADYPEEPQALGTPIMATCPGKVAEHLHILVPALSTSARPSWRCPQGSHEWGYLTGSRKEPTNSQLREMDYWEPEVRWITKDEIFQVAEIVGKSSSLISGQMVEKVVRAMGFRVSD